MPPCMPSMNMPGRGTSGNWRTPYSERPCSAMGTPSSLGTFPPRFEARARNRVLTALTRKRFGSSNAGSFSAPCGNVVGVKRRVLAA